MNKCKSFSLHINVVFKHVGRLANVFVGSSAKQEVHQSSLFVTLFNLLVVLV